MKRYEKLRRLREKTGYTQAEVAASLGVTQPTVSRWDSGRVRAPRRYEALVTDDPSFSAPRHTCPRCQAPILYVNRDRDPEVPAASPPDSLTAATEYAMSVTCERGHVTPVRPGTARYDAAKGFSFEELL